jgi:hypothetical protein
MSDYSCWWCSYSQIKNYKWELSYNQEMIDEMQYKFEKCEQEKKEDCSQFQKELKLYQERLEKSKKKFDIAEKKCKKWEEIRLLSKEENNL